MKALNEYDPRHTGWRKLLQEGRGGALMGTELKNNAAKLGRWVAQALLSGCSSIRVGLITRAESAGRLRQQILAVRDVKVEEFGRDANVDFRVLWGSLKIILDQLMAQPDGLYLLMRNPNKPNVDIYPVPSGEEKSLST